MFTDSIGNDGFGAGNGVNRFSELSSEDFVKIMFTELQNQDPTEPQDTSKLMEQLNSLRNIESNMQLMDEIGDLVGQNQFSSAANLVGKLVVGKDEQLQTIQGKVIAASIENDDIVLTLETGERMPFGNLEHVQLLEDDNSDN